MIKMIKLITGFIAILAATAAAAHDHPPITPYHWEVVKVVDGDTVVVRANWLPTELGDTVTIRLNGVDAPETTWRASCEAEITQGRLATAALTKMLAPSAQVVVVAWDKYGGRILGDFVVNGVPVTEALLKQGLVAAYSGAGLKHNWCT